MEQIQMINYYFFVWVWLLLNRFSWVISQDLDEHGDKGNFLLERALLEILLQDLLESLGSTKLVLCETQNG